jgi:magnesium transporter
LKFNNFDKYILEDIKGAEHPSDFVKRDNYSVLILRLPEIKKDIYIESFAFIIEDNIVYKYNRTTKKPDKLGTLDMLISVINTKVDKLISDTKIYHTLIDNLEDEIYINKKCYNFMNKWLIYKKEVTLINRLMFQSSVTIEQFVTYLKKDNNFNFNVHALEDIKEESKRVYDLSKVALDKLENLYNFYRAKVDEKMNKNVYYLTLLSGIFLPLTLLTGFFGMNTGGLPLASDPLGTWKVIGISLILEIIFFMPFIWHNFKNR